MKRFLFIAVPLLLLIYVFSRFDKQSQSSNGDPTSQGRPVLISISRLQREYESNEVSADSYFKGRPLEVYGQILAIRKDAFGKAVLDMKTTSRYERACAYLAEGEESKAARLSKGKTIAMICSGEGMSMGSAMLGECRIEENPHIQPSLAEQDGLTPSQWHELGFTPMPATSAEPAASPEQIPSVN